MRVLYRVGETRTEVETNDARLARRFAALFPGSRVHNRTGPPDTAPLLVVRQDDEGFCLTHGGGEERLSDLTDLLSEVEFAVALELLGQTQELTHVHGAAAATPRGTVLAFGASGSGKSSLALAWSKAGYPLYGDDLLLLDTGGRVRPFPRLVKVHSDRMRDLDVPTTEIAHEEPGSEEVWFDPRTQAGWADGPGSVTLLAEIEFRATGGLEVESVRGAQRLGKLLSAVHQTGVSRAGSVDRLIELLRRAPMVRVRFDSSQSAAAELVRMVSSS